MSERTPSLLLSLDAEKAFDRVNWTYLHATLLKFGLQCHTLSAIMALYSKPSAQVYTSEMLSKPFPISNGTRQGCPLSPIIFNLIMEPLAEHIRLNKSITGFKIGTLEHKINLFADDVIMMVTNPISSLASIQSVLQRFSTISYYKVNENKSYILDLGLDAITSNLLRNFYTYSWADAGISYLGITLTKYTRNLFSSNYIEAKQTLIRETSKLSKFEFSWAGRLAAFKMLILPRLFYTFRTLPIPLTNSYIKSLQSIINQYIWQGKKPRCSHLKTTKHKLAGGLGYVDIKDYHLAIILSQMKEWVNTHPTTLWGNIENTMTPGPNLKYWLFSTTTKTPKSLFILTDHTSFS